MAKYVIEIPDNTHWIQWIMEGTKDHHPYMDWKLVEDLTPYTEPDEDESLWDKGYSCGLKDGREMEQDEIRQKVEKEVWGLAKEIVNMEYEDFSKCFDVTDDYWEVNIMDIMSYSEAKTKYEEWRKRKDEIRVGDEVVVNGTRAVVMKLDETGNIDRYFTSDGTTFGNISGFQNYEVTKTNRHFSEVAELLKKMREE